MKYDEIIIYTLEATDNEYHYFDATIEWLRNGEVLCVHSKSLRGDVRHANFPLANVASYTLIGANAR